MQVKPLDCHDLLVANTKPKLTFDKDKDYGEQRKALREKFLELTGLDVIETNVCDLNLDIESEEKKDGYTLIRFTIESEKGCIVPCYLCIPDTGKEKYPVCVTLQGHSTGFHNSIGVEKYPEDVGKTRSHHALQAVEQGYIALAIEQRGMGEQACVNLPDRRVTLSERGGCYYTAVTASLLGRTVIGERCWDIKRAIDALSYFDKCDLDKIMINGGSGGGTASYYAACFDERIKLSVPVVAFCPYPDSILRFYHCSCNYIPHAFKYFDMQDLSCLIAPRRLCLINGVSDPSFLVEGAKRGYETVKAVYEKAGAPNNCSLKITEYGHYWANDIVWEETKKHTDALGWTK